MFRIREFSRFSRVSVKMLRHYDRLGLLVPAFVDPDTRYRYYSARQLPRLNRILALRDLGFSLADIADLLEQDLSQPALRRMLERRRLEIQRELEHDRRRLSQLESALDTLADPARVPAIDVVVRGTSPVRVASARSRVPDLESAVEEMFEALESGVARCGLRAPGPPLLLYHDR